ncbi:MAG TPA: response regulator [Candidatus Angelobacter sp.]|nr:response regulator [Candidatus Angelobacter sp.]
MALRILFADDSMTAQNMGKKILSEAGYDVVAVSNGAAAVKKIAEQKPDIIILDVYMPGYSGLEVCEKVRASLETVKIPVLLTVGKMEPHKPEDANRVKADGVIIKPFEASDLLAIVKKFEERIASAPPPPMMQQKPAEQAYEEPVLSAADAAREQRTGGRGGMQPMVDVPDHMAGSAAFGDLLGSEPPPEQAHFAVNTPNSAFETSVIVPAPPMPVTEYELPVSMTAESEQPTAIAPETEAVAEVQPVSEEAPVSIAPQAADESQQLIAVPVEDVPEPPPTEAIEPLSSAEEPAEVAATKLASVPEPPHPQFIPTFKEPEPPSGGYEILPTSVPPMPDLEIPREPALQETADEVTRTTVADHIEPGLMSTIGQQVEAFPRKAEEEKAPAEAPAATTANAGSESFSVPLPTIDATSAVTDDDFEARVAAAMAAYNHGPEVEPQHEPAAAQAPPEPARAPTRSVYAQAASMEPEPAATQVPSFEYRPAAGAAEAPPMVAADAAIESEAAPSASITEVPQMAVSGAHTSPQVAASSVAESVEAAVPEVAAAIAHETGAEHYNIAQAVHRAMERLKPDLVEEIMRELRAKK